MSEKSIATLKIIDESTGETTPVNVRTCAEAVTCPNGMTLDGHLAALDAHAADEGSHLTADQKAGLETQTGAQEKATAAKNEAIARASLLAQSAVAKAADDATTKANAARDAAYKYADGVDSKLTSHKDDTSNPHKVTAAQVGLGNVPNKSTNDMQPTYTEASALTALTSGERLADAFGKIATAITYLIAHLRNKTNPHSVTANQTGAVPTTGGTMSGNLKMNGGNILLLEGINYGKTLPAAGTKGRIFFKVVE